MAANAQTKIDRLVAQADDVISRKLKSEIAELERADASLADAQRAKARADSERRSEIQVRYADAFNGFNVETPPPVDDETPGQYRRRLFGRLQRKLPDGHELADLRADDIGNLSPTAFAHFEGRLLEEALREGQTPSFENLPADGSLVARHRVDSVTGEKSTMFYGRRSFIADMNRSGQRVVRFVDRNTGSILWGAPFEKMPERR
jgi:hypothetical protein